jgi:hypothetical protein
MSWKSLVIAGLLCVLAAPVFAVPSLVVTSTYNATTDNIEWIVSIDQDGTLSLATEAPLTLTPDTPTFAVNLRANSSASQTTHGAGDANGAANETWYYNETAAGSGVLLWNTQQLATDLEQDLGVNPFTTPANQETEGLWLDTAGGRLFAALGSDVNMPQPVNTLHIASDDGVLNWSNLLIAEDGVSGGGAGGVSLTGSFSSIKKADMNGDGAVNGLDVNPFVQQLTNPAGYLVSFPGLDGQARADINNDVASNGLDVQPFVVCVTMGGCPGGGAGGDAGGVGAIGVPEPATLALVALGVLALFGRRRS